MTPRQLEQIEKDLERLLGEFETMVGKAANDGAGKLHDATARLSSALDSARERVGAYNTQVRDSARQAARVTDDYVHEQPWQAIAAAVIVGLVAGIWLARR
jgi:ElaB/YqjD/DUF883 family membrane-anchored ribosome-binding protein